MTGTKQILIIAGPNGAGKTTFAMEYLPNEANCPIFVNADLIAAGLSPFRPARVAFRAGRLMLREIHHLAQSGDSFAFETTLSGRGYVRWIPQWQAGGYRVKLLFLRLPTSEAAIQRVAQRVAEGGHDVPEPVIRRRFDAGWRNFNQTYRHLVDDSFVYDNSDRVHSRTLGGGNALMCSQSRHPSKYSREQELAGIEAALIRAGERARRRREETARRVAESDESRTKPKRTADRT